MKPKFDQLIERLQAELALLPRRHQAAFFAACADRLMPLYETFSRQANWGDAPYLSQVLEQVWSYVGGENAPKLSLLNRIEEITPHGEEFDAPDSTLAQDAAICIDAAVRASSREEVVDLAWVEFAIEPAKIQAILQLSGGETYAAGDGEASLENEAASHPYVKSAFAFCSQTIEFLKSKDLLSRAEIESLRAAAKEN